MTDQGLSDNELRAGSNTFGLPRSLWVPVLAASEAALERYVGPVVDGFGRDALLVQARSAPILEANVPLWNEPDAVRYFERLHPSHQVWVRPTLNDYRRAFSNLQPTHDITRLVLDHVRNRKALIATGRSQWYVRLCPIEKHVNTNSGHRKGAEGLEKGHIGEMIGSSGSTFQDLITRTEIVYADPADLTKMLNIAPGTLALAGVAATQKLFYP